MFRRFLPLTLAALSITAVACGTETQPDPGNNPPPKAKGPVISAFSADKPQVAAGEQVTLSWSVMGATKLTIVATPGGTLIDTDSRFTDSVRSMAITATTRFDLTATGANGSSSQSVTVTVDANALGIVRFEANPNPGPMGGMSTVSWATTGGNMLRITDDMGNKLIETDQAVATGTVDVTLDRAQITLTLEVSNGAQQRTATLVLTAAAAPVIEDFKVTPGTFSGASAQVSVTWRTRNATSWSLTANGAAVPELPAGTATGTISVTVTVTTIFELTATSGAGSVTATFNVANAPGETEPNNDVASANPITTGGVGGEITDATDVDYFSITVGAGGNITAETSDGAGDCGFDTLITLYSLTGTIATALGSNDDGGAGLCSRIDPATDDFAVDLAAGTYYIEVRAYGMTGGVYTLVAVTGNAACGNGFVETSTGEQCDDGNASSGDGCSAMCAFESSGMLGGPGGDQTFSGALDPAGKVDIYVIDMAQAGYIFAETFLPTKPECQSGAGDTLIELIGPGGLLGTDDDGGQGLCSKISPTAYSWTAVGPGQYFLKVRPLSATAVIAAYQVHIRTFGEGCGNGVIEGNETCDDGNTTAGDGCNATCAFEGATESEMNNDAPSANALGMNRKVTGSITPADDVDYFSVTVPDGHHMDAFLSVGGFDTCTGGGLAQLELFAPDGTTSLAQNFGGGPDGRCGKIAPSTTAGATNLAAGTYYLKVSELFGGEINNYFLHVDFIAPACGNSIQEPNEQCDDGNMMAGDGCNAACAYEIAATISGTGGTASVNLATEDSFGIVEIQIATAGAGISVTTGDAMGMCAVESTLVLRQGDTRLGAAYSGGGTCASITHPDAAWATNLEAGSYFMVVTNSGMTTGAVDAVVTIHAAACGNSATETRAGEACDDGNTMAGDGCSATCRFEGAVLVEVEPNNDATKAQALTLTAMGPAIAAGAIDPVGDTDWFQFDVPMGQTKALLAETYGSIGNLMSCNGDTRLYLVDAMGMELMNNDDGGEGLCSKIDGVSSAGSPASALTGGRYYLRVQHYNNTALVSSYMLNVSLQ